MKSSFGHVSSVMFSFKKDFIYLFSERRREGERGRETAISNQLPLAPPTGDLACNPQRCPDRESHQRLFGSQAGLQSTEPLQPRLFSRFERQLWLELTMLNF